MAKQIDDLLEDFKDWKENPITRKLFEFFKAESWLHRNRAAMGECKRSSFLKSGEEYIKAMRVAEEYDRLLDLEFYDLCPEEEEKNESNPQIKES